MNTVPWLRSGAGSTPAEGGCVMQIVDWIHRNEWTDHPPCVHPVIRIFAIAVNDRLDDEGRQRLLDFVPRMMDTAGGDEALTRRLLGYLARQVYPIYDNWVRHASYDDKGAVLACIEAAENEAACAMTALATEAARAAEAAWAAGATKAAWAAKAAWGPMRPLWPAWAAEAAAKAAWAAPGYLEMLVGLLDRYDEITGRAPVQGVDLASVCAVLPDEFKVPT